MDNKEGRIIIEAARNYTDSEIERMKAGEGAMKQTVDAFKIQVNSDLRDF